MAVQAYCTSTTIKARLTVTVTDTEDDPLLGVIAGEANDWLEGRIGYPVGPIASEERLFDGSDTTYGGRCLPVYPWGVRTITQVRCASSTGGAYTTLAASDYMIRPPTHRRRTGWPGFEIWLSDTGSLGTFATYGFDVIGVTATWGWDAIPAALSGLATRLGVALFRSRSYGAARNYAVGEDAVASVAAEELSASDWRTVFKYADLKDIGAD